MKFTVYRLMSVSQHWQNREVMAVATTREEAVELGKTKWKANVQRADYIKLDGKWHKTNIQQETNPLTLSMLDSMYTEKLDELSEKAQLNSPSLDEVLSDIRMDVVVQGAVAANHAQLLDVPLKLVLVDLKSKYANVASWGTNQDVPCVELEATEDTMSLEPGMDKEVLTSVTFPEYVGWSIISAHVARYSLTVVLKKSFA